MRGNPLPPHRLLLSINRQDNTYHGLCYTSHGALAGTRNSSMGPPHEGSIWRPIAPWANALPLSYVPLPTRKEGRKCFIFNDALNTFYFMVIRRRTYGKVCVQTHVIRLKRSTVPRSSMFSALQSEEMFSRSSSCWWEKMNIDPRLNHLERRKEGMDGWMKEGRKVFI